MKWKRGAVDSDALWILGALFFVFYAWWISGGPASYESKIGTSTRSSTITSPRSTRSTQSSVRTKQNPPNTSPWYKIVKISSRGNVARERFAGNEYIVVQNVSKDPVTITGWAVTNGRDVRGTINVLNQVVPGIVEKAVIPMGVRSLWITAPHVLEPIILLPKEKAIITSGKMNKSASFLGKSFKVNKCSGYINEYVGYPLQPRLTSSCPTPSSEFTEVLLEDTCRQFLKRTARCHTPKYSEITTRTGERREYLDRTYGLSRQCREVILPRLNYGWCVLAHSNDSDFYKPEWRIYLNRNFELWDKGPERIRLYDAQGLLVDEIAY